ncbi:hypothetical protein NL30_36550 [Burkholderia contaminans]|uniref:hypothetical protein n=1 Tax=Burkholderia contaminans TaxID=488447 RepID=UPI000649C132|nr:hypothetical protein [Burkholderia contaminans]AKM45351.1 hypothetical protein NL30_36550 [Burkholderia contaminans]
MNLFIPIPLMILIFAAVFARLGHDIKVIIGCAVAAFLAICWAYSCLQRQLERWREQRDVYERTVMEQRYPFCHVTRLSSGEWFLTEKETGREYKRVAKIATTEPGNNKDTR